MRFFSLLLLTVTFIACSSSTPENISKKIDQLIAEDNYQQAIELLQNADPKNADADLPKLKEKTFLNYGLFLEYRGPEGSSMRDRMTSALEQFIKVLNINSENQKARSEVKQIMSIYDTMPNRSPGEEIMNDLRKLGFDF
jgi:tetratricopeptide (TPR) repeat protein